MTALLFAPFVWLLLALVVTAPAIVRWLESDATTYTLLNDDGTLEQITSADRDALIAQGWVEVEVEALSPTKNGAR